MMRPLSVLYVEDCAELQDAIAELLRDGGDDVVCCADAAEAQAALGERVFDVLLVDVKLDGVASGIDLTRRVLERTPGQPVILCSGAAVEPEVLALGPNLRALTKPFELHELESLLDRLRLGAGGRLR